MDLQTLLALGVLSFRDLSAYINNLPFVPTRIAELGLFQEEGLTGTNIVKIGMQDDQIVLVPNTPRGAPGQVQNLNRGKVKLLETTHLPQRSTVMADSLLNVYDPVNDPAGQSVAAVVNALQVKHRRNVDYTIEYHRMGAIKGLVLDADGSVIVDLFEEFEVEPIVKSLELNKQQTKVRTKILGVKRAIEDVLGGVPYTGIRFFCDSAFFDALIDHDDVKAAYERWQNGEALRNDPRGGFPFAGCLFEEVRGKAGSAPFVPNGEALAFPEGVPDMFITRFAPADYIETVKTTGIPYYTKAEAMEFNKGVKLESQSNPINLNTRPRAVIRCKAA
ncbi:major capsid protein [[Pseudomonas] boreopolis]|uniref:Minor capsid protein E n=1 Tax=Xanthomonas boreopolis TaxID=86183 RepID=A0A919KI99_9XANT|nr:minor capsid protein E [[Pseudomonas] boreopolis]